ncbi:hypothetical protein FHS35_009140 [Streptomyces umbrinus]|uniref:hypothetical protein n=2 Tax=Streptomyces umbrinus TaxID=67370 RepID=UPI00214DA9E5|nr:hypothetical protein [Streptomyces umbrinus]MCR3732222.1 hypothetical protein [Streptomyces umbrinus]
MTASSQTPNEAQTPPPLIHLPVAQAVAMVRSYDGLTVEAMAQGAVDQAQAESRAESTQVQQDREALAWFHSRWKIAAKLWEGRPLEDLLCVGEVLAALDGQMPTTLPFTMTWDGQVSDPDGDGPGEATFVPCTTSRGGRAVLALDDDQRLQLGEKLLATLHTTETCHTPGCGTSAEDLDASDPSVAGWICVQVAGVDSPVRWWCTAWCANSAITAAGAELAALDQAAAIDPHEPVPVVSTPAADAEEPVTYRPTPDTDTMALPAIAEALSGAAKWFADTAQDASGDDAEGGAL